MRAGFTREDAEAPPRVQDRLLTFGFGAKEEDGEGFAGGGVQPALLRAGGAHGHGNAHGRAVGAVHPGWSGMANTMASWLE